jgi:hypothetical protein
MTASTPSAAGQPTDPAAAVCAPADSLSQGALNINPTTGLCTDYLNHFNEAIMVLEMLPGMPDCMDDFLAWRPRSYSEHFAASRFKNREAVIAAYQAANPAVRHALDALADSMNAVLTATREAIEMNNTTAAAGVLAQCAVAWLKPLLARAGIVINGSATGRVSKTKAGASQAAVDALLQR